MSQFGITHNRGSLMELGETTTSFTRSSPSENTWYEAAAHSVTLPAEENVSYEIRDVDFNAAADRTVVGGGGRVNVGRAWTAQEDGGAETSQISHVTAFYDSSGTACTAGSYMSATDTVNTVTTTPGKSVTLRSYVRFGTNGLGSTASSICTTLTRYNGSKITRASIAWNAQWGRQWG